MKDYAKEILKIIFIIKLPSHIHTIIFVFFSLFFWFIVSILRKEE